MACFDITKSLCDQISSMICKYWWSQIDKENKVHWISWEKLVWPKREGGLGFRDLHFFNLAMLARQAWRLIQNPSSLCAQVLAAKYFPDGQLLNAKERTGMSFSWKSILKGIKVLREGVIWRVGNGQNINIWSDPWLPRSSTRRPITVRGRNDIITRLSELINPVTGWWDEGLINQTFCSEDANLILQVQINELAEDQLAWHYDKKGIFSVKSAYRVTMDSEARKMRRGLQTSSNSFANTRVFNWKKIWSIPLPNKIRLFIWRMAHHSLPLRMKLIRRGMDVSPKCPICYRIDEDGGHCFFKCKKVKEIWRALQLEDIRVSLLTCSNPQDVIEEIFKLQEEHSTKIFILLWIWWFERNKANAGECIRSCQEIVTSIHIHWKEYLEAEKNIQKKKDNTIQQHWQPPQVDFLKINVDGAFNDEDHTGGWGFIIRNSEGNAEVAGAGKLIHLQNALQAESWALLNAIERAAELGCCKVIFETDSLMLQQAISSESYDASSCGPIFMKAKSMLSLYFYYVKVV